MKEIKCILKKSIWLFAVASAVFFAGCQDENDQQNDNNNDSTTDYPATADVIHNAVTDIDGNTYDAVRIGDQIWMASNLRTTHYANGEALPQYETPNSNIAVYGLLYEWITVMHGEAPSNNNPSGVQGICPTGWHIPSDEEFSQLWEYCATHNEYMCNNTASYIAKSLAANNYWTVVPADECYGGSCAPGVDQSTNNATGFSAIPAYIVGEWAEFSTSSTWGEDSDYTTQTIRVLRIMTNDAEADLSSASKHDVCSVRCVKD